ncbi:MAG: Type secretion system protein [Pedosphaera sp.]|nr:Type secretion system protein [Pedosphaera sp.]
MALILSPRQLSQRAELYYQLAQLTAAGVGLINSLEMLSRSPPARSFREPLRQLVMHLGHGDTFADALVRLGLWTPSFDIALIRAGEHSGRLDAVFKLLGNYYSDRARLLRQMISELAYPVFLFHFAIVLFPFLDFFKTGNVVVFLLKSLGVLIPIYVAVFFMVYAAQGRRGAEWRAFLERILKPIPVLGAARHYLALARLAAALEALINAGVTIIEAWELAATASGSPALRHTVLCWRPQVTAGLATPSEVVSASPQFPELFANLYHTGEISGQLDDSLRRLHAYYSEEGTRKLHLLAQWMPRGIYFGVALMVGYKVVSFYTDYFDQVQKAGGF